MNEIVLDHYRNPRNIGALAGDDTNLGTGTCGAPGEGVMIQMQVRIDARSHRIAEARFKAFGCAWSIAACSFLTGWVTGRTVEQALAEAAEAMTAGLQLPPERVRHAVLVAEALRAAVQDWRARSAEQGGSGGAAR